MRRISAAHDIDIVGAACLFLADPLENALRSRTLDAGGNARIPRLECLSQFFRNLEVQRRVEADLAFLPRGLDQGWRDGAWFRRGGAEGLCKGGRPHQCRRCLKYITLRIFLILHGGCPSMSRDEWPYTTWASRIGNSR